MFEKPSILLESIARDEFRLEESRIWNDFPQDNTHIPVHIVGLFLVPGRILVAVGKPIKGLTEVPCVAVAKNNWQQSNKDTMDLCEMTVQRKGATFRDLVGHGDKCKQGSIKCRFAESPFTVYYAGFASEFVMDFEPSIIY
jgi:hypothetical protein